MSSENARRMGTPDVFVEGAPEDSEERALCGTGEGERQCFVCDPGGQVQYRISIVAPCRPQTIALPIVAVGNLGKAHVAGKFPVL